MTEAAIKAAKKSLKRQDSGQMKLKELAKAVASKVDDMTVEQAKEVIQKSSKFQVDGKVVVLSGNITAEASQRLHAAGVAALVQKPFEFARIKSLLDEL